MKRQETWAKKKHETEQRESSQIGVIRSTNHLIDQETPGP